jgi:DNA-binding NarL/FixJ family response regulator
MMSTHDGYILVLDPEHQGVRIPTIEAELPYPVFVAKSQEQAVARLSQGKPSLIILMGSRGQSWSETLVRHLRQLSPADEMTIVALTDSASPQWSDDTDIPEIDGFLVKPLSLDIIKSLVESAQARQAWQEI